MHTINEINYGSTVSVLDINNSEFNFSKTGYHFVNWEDSNGTTYLPNAQITINADMTLTAQWEANTFVVRFNLNLSSGAESIGSSSMAEQTFTYGQSQSLRNNTFAVRYYEFLGWTDEAQGSQVVYTNGQDLSNLTVAHNTVIELYAVWNKVSVTTNINITVNNCNFVYYLVKLSPQGNETIDSAMLASSHDFEYELDKNTSYGILIVGVNIETQYLGSGTLLLNKITFTTTNNVDTIIHNLSISSYEDEINDGIVV